MTLQFRSQCTENPLFPLFLDIRYIRFFALQLFIFGGCTIKHDNQKKMQEKNKSIKPAQEEPIS